MRFGLRAADAKSLVDVYEKTRAEGFGDEVKRRILIGTYVLSAGYYDAYYLKALKVRRRIADDFESAFQKVDALLTPTAPSAAFGLGENASDPVAMYLNDIFTVPVNLAGLPGASIPAGLDAQGLPLGLQLIGRPLDEGTLFSLAGALEQAADFKAKPERWWV
jgi:aspartyl-tRNA(Asn)/glutamyl-tRNA(Gln) amidotransferase subunit A